MSSFDLQTLACSQWKLVACSLATAIGTVGFALGVAAILRAVVDHAIDAQATELTLLVAAAIAIVLGQAGLQFLNSIIGIRLESDTTAFLVTTCWRRILALPVSFFQTTGTGKILNLLINDVRYSADAIPNGISSILRDSLLGTVLLGCLFSINGPMALWVLAMSILLLAIGIPLRRSLGSRHLSLSNKMDYFGGKLVDSILGIEVIKGMNLQAFFSSDQYMADSGFWKCKAQARRVETYLNVSTMTVASIASLSSILFGLHMIEANQIDIAQLIFFHVILGSLLAISKNVPGGMAAMRKGRESMFRLARLLSQEIESEKADHDDCVTSDLVNWNGNVWFKNIHFSYEKNKPVFKALDLTIPGGSVFAILGRTGVGKSTLGKLLLKYYRTSQGSINLDTTSLVSLCPEEVRKKVAVVDQNVHLFSGTLRYNICFDREDELAPKLERIAKLAFLDDVVKGLPLAWNTVLGQGGRILSTGQLQRVALARALIRDYGILVLDEATSNLDKQTQTEVLDSLIEYRRGHTTILISHDNEVISRASQCALIDGGITIGIGTPMEIIALRDSLG